MSTISKKERETQDRVIALFQKELGYRYLGNWEYRENNSNLLRATVPLCFSASVFFCLSVFSPAPHLCAAIPAISSHVWTQAPSPDTVGTYYGLALADMNEDGRIDIVATKYNQGLQVWLNTKGGSTSGGESTSGDNWERLKTNLPEKGFYNQVVVCDLNGDKQPDILGARDGNGIELWLNKSAEIWELSKAGLPDTGRYFDVKAADLNSDGVWEIIAALDHGVSIWSRNAQGKWLSVGQHLPVYEYYHSIEAADLNLDGHPDLIAGNSNNGGIKAWLGDGEGHWQYASGLPTIGTYYDATASDINSDGRQEIITASNSNQGLMVMTSDISGKWKQTGTGLSTTGYYYSVICKDINLDGKPDIIAANNNNEGVGVWLGDGQGHFMLASIGLPTSGYCHGMSIGDINLDGYPDIVAASSNGLRVYYGRQGRVAFLGWSGRAGYTTDGVQPEYGTQGTLFTYQVNYVNTKNLPLQKGYPVLRVGEIKNYELKIKNEGRREEKIYDNDKQDEGMFSGKGSSSGNCPAFAYSMTPVDNEDNTYTDGRMYSYTTTLPMTEHGYSYQFEAIDTEYNIAIGTPVYPQIGPRITMDDISRQEWMQISTPETSREHYSMQLVDINMDGRLDVVAASSSGIKVWIAGDSGVWLPASHGLPTGGIPSGRGNSPGTDFYYGISLVDFNLDGLMDIVATKMKGVEAWLGDGQGRWSKASCGLPEDGFFYGVVSCDINGDDFPDIVAGTNDQKGIRVWIGNGKGEWRLSSEGLPTDERLCSVAVTDLNDDGIPDIVAGDYNGIRGFLHESSRKMEYVGSLPVSTRFDLAGQPDILFGRYDGIIMGWTGDKGGNWTHLFTDLGGVDF
ncbi:MAG: VCBS repeat-containing protein [bacterium]